MIEERKANNNFHERGAYSSAEHVHMRCRVTLGVLRNALLCRIALRTKPTGEGLFLTGRFQDGEFDTCGCRICSPKETSDLGILVRFPGTLQRVPSR